MITAALCKDALKQFGMSKVVMLTHRKELIEQNADKMRKIWPGAPMGIYSASVGRKEYDEPIVFAGIQSIQKNVDLLGKVDLAICDECHMISHKEEGGYRELVETLREKNNDFRLVGLTATPYRLGHGLITESPAIFDEIVKPIDMLELIEQGFLAPLRSKPTTEKLSGEGVRKLGGEYVTADLEKKLDKELKNRLVVEEIIAFSGGRIKWLIFCIGVKHAENVAEELRRQGVKAVCLTQKNTKAERERILRLFEIGEITALVGADILTTGFDCPNIDLIVFLRPTMSPGLYVQMAGRGTRLKSHTDHCLVLDFAGVVAMHGPITRVQPPKKAGSGNGEAPVKLCDSCREICHAAERFCSACGFEFPPPKEKEFFLHGDCIMGIENSQAFIDKWTFQSYVTAKNIECILVKYFLRNKKTPLMEYLLVYHPGWVGQEANRVLKKIAMRTNVTEELKKCRTIQEVVRLLNKTKRPDVIEYRKEGKYPRIIDRLWHGNNNI